MADQNDRMLTTVDNPYNPFSDPDRWRVWDQAKGYNTPQYLARITFNSEELTDELFEEEYQRAIDEILELNTLGIYTVAYPPKNYQTTKG